MQYKLPVISVMIALSISVVGCTDDSPDLSLADLTEQDALSNYHLQGEVSPAWGLGDTAQVCADVNNDLQCDDHDIMARLKGGDFTVSDPNIALLKSPLIAHVVPALRDAHDVRLLHPAANNYPAGVAINISPISTLVFALTDHYDAPVPFTQAVETVTSSLRQHISSDITDLGEISLHSDDEKAKFVRFNTQFLQYLSELEQAEHYERTLHVMGRYVDEIITVFSLDDQTAIELLKAKINQQELTVYGRNDTGVVDYLVDGQLQAEASVEYPEQDAAYGRDQSGQKGFSFVKLDAKGQPLTDDAAAWSCVKDLNTGLIWEVKVDDPASPRDKNRLFAIKTAQYSPSSYDIALATCTEEGSGQYCETEEYAHYLNAQALCGKTDWRLPTLNEQYDVLDLGAKEEDPNLGLINGMDRHYFPNMVEGEWGAGWYWNSSRAANYYENTHFIGLDQVGDLIGQTDLGSLGMCDVADINGMACTDGQTLPVRMVAQ